MPIKYKRSQEQGLLRFHKEHAGEFLTPHKLVYLANVGTQKKDNDTFKGTPLQFLEHTTALSLGGMEQSSYSEVNQLLRADLENSSTYTKYEIELTLGNNGNITYMTMHKVKPQ